MIAPALVPVLTLAASAALAAPTPTFPVPALDAGFRVDWFQSSVAPHSLASADTLIGGGSASHPVTGSATMYLSTVNLNDGTVPFAGPDPVFAVHVTGYVFLSAGDYTFFATHDDGMRLTIGGDDVIVFDADTASRTDLSGSFTLAEGYYAVDAVVWEQGGAFNFALGTVTGQGARAPLEGLHAASVPEPLSLALAGIGLLGLAVTRRSRG